MPAAPLILRCAECAHVRHDRCVRRSGGLCRCRQCWRSEIIATAKRRIESSADTGTLRDSLTEIVALEIQGEISRQKVAHAPPVRYGHCLCGCGIEIIGKRYGRNRLYLNQAHRQRAYARRKAAAGIESAPGPLAG